MVSLRPSGRVPSVVGSAGSRPHLPRVSPGPDAADTLRKHAATHGDLQAVEADGGSQTTTNHAFSVTVRARAALCLPLLRRPGPRWSEWHVESGADRDAFRATREVA